MFFSALFSCSLVLLSNASPFLSDSQVSVYAQQAEQAGGKGKKSNGDIIDWKIQQGISASDARDYSDFETQVIDVSDPMAQPLTLLRSMAVESDRGDEEMESSETRKKDEKMSWRRRLRPHYWDLLDDVPADIEHQQDENQQMNPVPGEPLVVSDLGFDDY